MKKSDRDETKTKRRYEAPRVVESAAFETLALSCGKNPDEPTGPGCLSSPQLS